MTAFLWFALFMILAAFVCTIAADRIGFGALLVMIGLIVAFMGFGEVQNEKSYKECVIDAQNGDLKYEMVVDSTTQVDTSYVKK